MEEKYVDREGNEWTIASSASGWLWRKEYRATGATEDSTGPFGSPEECLRDARSHGMREGYRPGGECLQRHDGLWRWRVVGLDGKVVEQGNTVYSTEDSCLANARANAVRWDTTGVDPSTTFSDELLGNLSVHAGDAETATGRAGVDVHAVEVDVGTAVGGGVSGDVERSRVTPVASPESIWKSHQRKIIGGVGALLLAALAIAGGEIITRAAGDLYDHFFAAEVSTTLKGNVKGIYSMTQDEYDALEEYDPNSLYVITDK